MKSYPRKLFSVAVIVLGYMLIGTVAYHVAEGWKWVDAFYFTAITISTIGYGDLYPTMAATKLFTIAYAFMGIGILFYVIGTIGKHYVEQEERRLARLYDAMSGNSKKARQKTISQVLDEIKKT